MADEQTNLVSADWSELDKVYSGLQTMISHTIEVKREAIPLVFVPGVMGSVLRLAGTDGTGKSGGYHNMRWDPGDSAWMGKRYFMAGASYRRRMVIGPGAFNGEYLEVHDEKPFGNGWSGVSKTTYHPFLKYLQNPKLWGALNKIFELPVYAVGYNWTDTNLNNGKKLAKRIDEIIAEAKKVTGACEKVILITHSMGGLVSRCASELAGAQSKIFGIVHGVQPVTGSAAAYWRVKAGFENPNKTYSGVASVLGNNGKNVTTILGNMPGGLELLPNHLYTTNTGSKGWLVVKDEKKTLINLPVSDPYEEIYRVMGTGSEIKNPGRKIWGAIDPDLLDPANNAATTSTDPDDPNVIDADAKPGPWNHFLSVLQQAEKFQRQIGKKYHPVTYSFHGKTHKTADKVEMLGESSYVDWDSYPRHKFNGYALNAEKKERRYVIQQPAGDGDGTVPASSGSALDSITQRPPEPTGAEMEHEPAYNKQAARDFSVKAIAALCAKRYEEKTGKKLGP